MGSRGAHCDIRTDIVILREAGTTLIKRNGVSRGKCIMASGLIERRWKMVMVRDGF